MHVDSASCKEPLLPKLSHAFLMVAEAILASLTANSCQAFCYSSMGP